MTEHIREDPKIAAAAERQMQAWALYQEIAGRILRPDEEHPPGRELGPFLTISREAGAGASEIAEMVGRKLGWEVLDKSLVDYVARRGHLSRSTLALVDETEANWAYDTLGPWLDHNIIPHEKYVALLTRIVMAAARQGKVIFVGRGGRFLLPYDRGPGVRIVASEKYRVAQIMRRQNLSAADARRFVQDVDRGRRDFVQRFFHRDVADPHQYDLVVNVEHLGPLAAAELIAQACRP